MTGTGRVARRRPLVYVRELERADLGRLVEIEEACHPPEVRDGIDFFDALLGREWHEWPVLHGSPLPARRPIRLGLSVGSRLTGYLLARLCEVDGQRCVHVDDLAVLPDQRRHLIRLLDGFVRQHRTLNGDVPVIAHGYEPEMELWDRHRRVLERWGAGFTGPDLLGERIGGRDVYRVRWEPRPARAPRRVEPSGDEGSATRLGVVATVRRGGDEGSATRLDVRSTVRTSSEIVGAARTSGDAGAGTGLETVGSVRVDGEEFDIQLAGTVAQWELLAPAWDRLLARSPAATGFQTFRLLRLWWDHFGLSGTPFIVVLRRAGQLSGIAPLAIFPTIIGGRAVRRLGFIGSRWEVDRPGFLFADEPSACAQALAWALLDRRHAWDVVHLYEQLPDSTSLAVLTRSLRDNGYLVGQLPDSICPYIRTVGSWDAFLDACSKNLRRNLRRARRDLERAGRLEYRVVDDPAALEAAFARYLALEARSWKADTQVGLALNAVHKAFYRDMAMRLGRECRVQFRFIELVREPVLREPSAGEAVAPATIAGTPEPPAPALNGPADEPGPARPVDGPMAPGPAVRDRAMGEPVEQAPPHQPGMPAAGAPLMAGPPQTVAGTFGIQHAGTFYSLKIAHDKRFARASPGTLLESFEIRDCFEGEVTEYDFLGGFLSNKNRWTDEARTTVQVFAFPRRGRWIALYLNRLVLRPRVKNVLRRMGWLKPLLSWRDRLRTPPSWRDRRGA